MTLRVLLTGATGFVGRPVLQALASAGCEITIVARNPHVSGLPAGCRLICSEDMFAQNAEWWQQACEGIEVVVHLAWYVDPADYLRSARNLDCLQGTLALAKGAVAAGVRRVVGVGTCFEYDVSYGMLSTATPLLPQTPYASAKVAAYLALSAYLAGQGREFAWARLFYLYGAGEKPARLVPYLHERLAAGLPVALSSGNQVRDYLAVDEAAARIVQLALSSQCGAVNVCSGIPVTIRQLATDIAVSYGRTDLLQFGARPDSPFDPPCVVGVP